MVFDFSHYSCFHLQLFDVDSVPFTTRVMHFPLT